MTVSKLEILIAVANKERDTPYPETLNNQSITEVLYGIGDYLLDDDVDYETRTLQAAAAIAGLIDTLKHLPKLQ